MADCGENYYRPLLQFFWYWDSLMAAGATGNPSEIGNIVARLGMGAQ
jgi:hypothetical protein